MATTKANLNIDIEVQSAKAGKKVQRFGKQGQKSFKSMEKASKQFSLAFKGAIALFAGQKVLGAFKSVTDAAIKQENAINALNQQLKLSGDFSEAASKDMQEFASSLQSVSTQGDETTLELLALAKTFDTTDAGAKKLTLAATELAAATGKAPQEALKQLAKSYSGLAGELGESLPATREFTQEQLKAGAAVDLVIERFGGSATGKLATFDGALTQLSNSFGDLQEEIGFSVTKSPELIEAFGGLQRGVEILSKFIKDSELDFGAIIADGIEFAVKAANLGLKAIVRGLGILTSTALESAKGFNQIAIAVLDIGKSETGLKILQTGFEKLSDAVGIFIAGLAGISEFLGFDATALNDAAQEMANLAVASSQLDTEKIEQMQESLYGNVDALTVMQEEVAKTDESFIKLGDDIVAAFDKGTQSINKTSKDLAKGLDGPQTKAAEREAGQSFGETAAKNFEKNFKGDQFAGSLLSTIESGSKEGGKEAGEQAGVALAQTAGKGIATAFGGPIAGQIFGIFSNLSLLSEEEIQTFITGLVDGIVLMVEALADNADVIVTALIDALLIDGGLLRIGIAIMKGMVEASGALVVALVGGLAQGLSTFFTGFAQLLSAGLNQFLSGFTSAITSIPGKIFDAISDGASAIFDAISDALSFDLGGGGGGFGLGGDKGLLGGSIVPGLLNQGGIAGFHGYNNGGAVTVPGAGNSDSVPALLTPGEVVIKKDAVNGFDQYVGEIAKAANSGNSGNDQPILLQVSLGDEILEERILRLNQNNARLA